MSLFNEDEAGECGRYMPKEEVVCTRGRDHDGQHVADNDEEIIAIWEDGGNVLYAMEHLKS